MRVTGRNIDTYARELGWQATLTHKLLTLSRWDKEGWQHMLQVLRQDETLHWEYALYWKRKDRIPGISPFAIYQWRRETEVQIIDRLRDLLPLLSLSPL